MTNEKIQKVAELIVKTKKNILKRQARLRELERQRVALEDAEIVARFREGNMTEDDLIAARQKANRAAPEPEIVEKVEYTPGEYNE